MKIKILGTRGEIEESAPYHSRHSGVLIDDELLLDAGEKEFLRYNPKVILITHLHPDHAFFVRPSREAEISIPVFAPESFHANGLKVQKFNSRIAVNGYDIRPIPTIHSHRIKSQAYLISRDNKKILYTGDMIWIKKWYDRYLKNLDLVITEGSFIRKNGMIRRHKESGKIYGHAGVPRLIDRFSPFCSFIVLTHFGSWFYRNNKEAHKKINQLSREYKVHINAGYDNMQLEV